MDLFDLDGMYVGELTSEELEDFDQACVEGTAYRSYEGASGLLGLAKVRLGHRRAHQES